MTPATATSLVVRVDAVPDGLTVRARLFPSFGVTSAPTLAVDLGPDGPRAYSGAFTLDGPAFAGYVHVWVEGGAPRREIVSDVTLIGSPGAGWGRATPRGNPGAGWGRAAPVVSSDGQVLLFSKDRAVAADQVITIQASDGGAPAPPWATRVGQAYRIASNAPSLAGMSISFSYLGSAVPAGEEPGLRIYRWDAAAQRWAMLPTALNPAQNSASALLEGPGLYALMASIVLPIDHAGWNLVAYPAPDHAMPEALASIEGYYTTVYGYDPGDSVDPWSVYDVGVPPEWAPLVNDLRELRYGRGYWIRATQPITALLKGGQDAALLSTSARPALFPATYYGVAPAGARAGAVAQAWVRGALCGQAQTEARTVEGAVRSVFVIRVRAAGEGADAGCGAPGQPVTIVFLDGAQTVGTYTARWDNSRVQRLGAAVQVQYLPFVRR